MNFGKTRAEHRSALPPPKRSSESMNSCVYGKPVRCLPTFVPKQKGSAEPLNNCDRIASGLPQHFSLKELEPKRSGSKHLINPAPAKSARLERSNSLSPKNLPYFLAPNLTAPQNLT